MGQNKYLNYILLAAIAFLLILQFWNPFKKASTETDFEKTFQDAQATLDRFQRLNDSLEAKAALLKIERSNIDSLFSAGMGQYSFALSRIDEKISVATREYSRLIKGLNEEKIRLQNLQAPDSLPTLEDLRNGKYLNAQPR